MRAVAGLGAALFGLPLVPPPLLWPHKTKWRLVVSPPFGTEGKEGGLEVHYRGKGGVKERDPVSVLGFSRIISDLKSFLIYVLVLESVFTFFLLSRNHKGDATSSEFLRAAVTLSFIHKHQHSSTQSTLSPHFCLLISYKLILNIHEETRS